MLHEKFKIKVTQPLPKSALKSQLKNKYLNGIYNSIISDEDKVIKQKLRSSIYINRQLKKAINRVDLAETSEYLNLLHVFGVTKEILTKQLFKACLNSDIDKEFGVFIIQDIAQTVVQQVFEIAPKNNGKLCFDIAHLSNSTKEKIQNVFIELGLCRQDFYTSNFNLLNIELNETNLTEAKEQYYFEILEKLNISEKDLKERLLKLNILSTNYETFVDELTLNILEQMPYTSGFTSVMLNDFTNEETVELVNLLTMTGIHTELVYVDSHPVSINLCLEEKRVIIDEYILEQGDRELILSRIDILHFSKELKQQFANLKKIPQPISVSHDNTTTFTSKHHKVIVTTPENEETLDKEFADSIRNNLIEGLPTENIFSCLILNENHSLEKQILEKIEKKPKYKIFISLFKKYFPKQFFKTDYETNIYDNFEKFGFYISWKF